MRGEVFWDSGRRRYVSRLLSHIVLLLLGALGTSEIFKLPLRVKVVMLAAAGTLLVVGTVVCPPADKGED